VPASLSQVWVLVAFIIPGFVLMRVKRVVYPTVEVSTGSTVLDSLALSCVVYALTSPVLYISYLYRWPATRPVLFSILALVVLLVVPCVLGTLYVRFTRSGGAQWLREFLGFPNPDPTAWDYLFRKRRAYWVWLTFKSGQMMAGLFGPNSFASSYPHNRDLYVEKLMRLDEYGRVVELIKGSAGALVMMEDLERIQFFEIDEVNA
jgi:hypothetical protein